jgi:hypothetical protein
VDGIQIESTVNGTVPEFWQKSNCYVRYDIWGSWGKYIQEFLYHLCNSSENLKNIFEKFKTLMAKKIKPVYTKYRQECGKQIVIHC